METFEFNAFYLFNETFDSWIMLFTTYVSIVFAFLIASSISAEKLNRTLASLAVGLFSVAALFFIVMSMVAGRAVLGTLQTLAELPSGAGREGSTTFSVVMVGTVTVLMVMSYAASLIFFLYQRKRSTTST